SAVNSGSASAKVSACFVETNSITAGLYLILVKAYTFHGGVNYTNVEIRASSGGSETRAFARDNDANGTWHDVGLLKIPEGQNRIDLRFTRFDGKPLYGGGRAIQISGVFLTSQTNLSLDASDYANGWNYPEDTDTSPPVSGNYLRNSSFETGVQFWNVGPKDNVFYDHDDL